MKENPIDYDHCRCLECGEVYLVDEENPYHTQQFCRGYCYRKFAESLGI